MTELTLLPDDARVVADWQWSRIEPYYKRLQESPLDAQSLDAWMREWTRLGSLLDECLQRLYVACSENTADPEVEARFNRFVEEIYPRVQTAEQVLKEKLLASELQPANFDIPLRNMRAEAALFRAANLPLQTEEQKQEQAFDRILGSEMIPWDGSERTPAQMLMVLQEADRATRERVWRLTHQVRLEHRAALNKLWGRMLHGRLAQARNAGYTLPDGTGDYRAFRWQQYQRFDYTPDDCKRFADAIEEVVVPAATRLYDRARARLGVDTLRPWDLYGPQGFFRPCDPPGTAPLKPFASVEELTDKCAAIFSKLDPELGGYFDTMRREALLDLPNRLNKAPGGYCVNFEHARRPFIFMNTVGMQEDVQTLLHESGHAFHAFESFALPYVQQHAVPLEFCEVASISMELIGAHHLNGGSGFYDNRDAARARSERLETCIYFWSYMAVVDLFQHWVYENPLDAMDPENCDMQWSELWDRFMPGVDWNGLDEEKASGWHRKPHIFTSPFYYVEYGIAQLGAVQVWSRSLQDQTGALRAYRRALALGGTANLPQLFRSAGAQLRFDADILRSSIELMERTIYELENR